MGRSGSDDGDGDGGRSGDRGGLSRRRVLRATTGTAALGVAAATGAAADEGSGGGGENGEGRGPPPRHVVGTEGEAATGEARRRAHSVRRVLEFGDRGSAVAGRFPAAAREALARRPDVRYVEPDGEMAAVGERLPWGVDRIDADRAHADGATGAGADVAILDTGIDSDHPDLAANLGTGRAFVPCGETYDGTACAGNGNDCHETWDDDDDHGTHCAGIAGAVDDDDGVLGVATAPTLHAVRVLGCDGVGLFSDVAAGIEYTADRGWDVASLSLGASSGSETVRDACAYATDRGTVVVAAAGNDGPCADCVAYPARYDSVIAVSATDDDDTLAGYSSTGPEVDLAAPGTAIPSTVPGGIASFSGTSMACPHVSGAAGLAAAAGRSGEAVRAALTDTAEDVSLSADEGGSGLVDAEAVAPTVVGEAGTVTVGTDWQRVALEGAYTDPVVVASVGSAVDPDPVHARVRNAGAEGFEIRLEEWAYQDGNHADERVDYVVVEAGFHETTTGIDVLAGTVAADGSGWTTAGYGRTFDSQRYVFATVNSDVDPTPVSTRLTDVGLDGFAVTCQEEEANRTDGTSDHATETIGYLATQPRLGGSGAAGESLASVFATGEWTTGALQDAYDATPALVHGMQSYFGRDTTDLRGRGYSATSFDLLAQEAASANDETNHVREYVATLALAPGPIET